MSRSVCNGNKKDSATHRYSLVSHEIPLLEFLAPASESLERAVPEHKDNIAAQADCRLIVVH